MKLLPTNYHSKLQDISFTVSPKIVFGHPRRVKSVYTPSWLKTPQPIMLSPPNIKIQPNSAFVARFIVISSLPP